MPAPETRRSSNEKGEHRRERNAGLARATRRDFLVGAGASVGMLAAAGSLAAPAPAKAAEHEHQAAEGRSSGPFWPEGIRPVISISMQFEAGGQPSVGTDSPFPKRSCARTRSPATRCTAR